MSASSYGLLSARRRWNAGLLPALTAAMSSALLYVVLALHRSIDSQLASFGAQASLSRVTTVVIIMMVVVTAVEVSIGATRCVTQRRVEIGLLLANGTAPRKVMTSLMLEPVTNALSGALVGVAVSCISIVIASHAGWAAAAVPATRLTTMALLTLAVASAAAVLASIGPIAYAVSRPPVQSLTRRS
jgi:ABC-type lipoprotein release transport system permease subunit